MLAATRFTEPPQKNFQRPQIQSSRSHLNKIWAHTSDPLSNSQEGPKPKLGLYPEPMTTGKPWSAPKTCGASLLDTARATNLAIMLKKTCWKVRKGWDGLGWDMRSCQCGRTCVSVLIHQHIHIHMHIHIHPHLHMHLHLPSLLCLLFTFTFTYTHPFCIYIHKYSYIHAYLYMYIRICLFVYLKRLPGCNPGCSVMPRLAFASEIPQLS